MKKLFTLLAAVLLTASVFAQSPEKMSYQAVIRNSSDQLVTDQAIGMQISILQGTADGSPVYVETQTPTTNANGLVSIEIGDGTVLNGDFSTIDWANGPYFIKTETDPVGGTSYTITGTSQLLSVPYALHAKTAKNGITTAQADAITTNTAKVGYTDALVSANTDVVANTAKVGVSPGTAAGQMQYWDGTAWVTVAATEIEGAALQMIGGVPTWTGGTPPTVPGAPTIGTATAGDGQASVSFTAPASDGGSTIISYTATSSPGGITGTLNQAGSGTITVTGLTNGTAYTFSVTATNAIGTGAASAASNSVTPVGPTEGTLTDIDGNVYQTVTIGTQEWMAENLKTTKYNDGTNIPLVTDGTAWKRLTTPGYCWYDNDQATYGDTYGALYNWYTVETGNLCPAGWHIPTDAEWTQLTAYLGGESVAGGKLKETGTTHWNSPNEGATNESGFTALPGGGRYYGGSFAAIGSHGYWWSATDDGTYYAWYRYMYYDHSSVGRNGTNKDPGFSVRCLQD